MSEVMSLLGVVWIYVKLGGVDMYTLRRASVAFRGAKADALA
jgi:hypothetical protein